MPSGSARARGPRAIRDQSRLVRAFESEVADYDIRAALKLVDCGDVVLTPSRIEDAFERIEEASSRIIAAGATPLGLGGDGSISLPLVRATSRKWPELCVLHVDSHTDCHAVNPDHPYDAATQFSHTALEQRISASNSYHVGIRGSTYRPGVMEHTRSLGYNIITMRDYMRRGEADVLAELHRTLQGRPVYLSWDMDAFDPSVAPGVCTPTWGGFTAREGLQFLRGLAGLNLVGIDINTVSPGHDVNGHGGASGRLPGVRVPAAVGSAIARDQPRRCQYQQRRSTGIKGSSMFRAARNASTASRQPVHSVSP